MPKDSPGQIAKLQLNNMGFSGQASEGANHWVRGFKTREESMGQAGQWTVCLHYCAGIPTSKNKHKQ